MKLAVTGVAGAGKTTLCKLIGEHTTLEVMPDWMDVVLNEAGYSSGREVFEAQGEAGGREWYIESLRRKVTEDKARDNFVADKSILDHGARWFARRFASATPAEYDQVKLLLGEGKMAYDRTIILPLGDLNSVADDTGMRDVDFRHRELIEVTIHGLANQLGIHLQPYAFNFSDDPSRVLKDLRLSTYVA